MGLRQLFPYNIIPNRNYSYQEVAVLLQANGLEKKVEKISPYLLPFRQDYYEEDLEFLSTIDAVVYYRVFELLLNNDLPDHCNAICSILKEGYSNKIIAEQNQLDLSQFDEQLFTLYSLLKKSKIHQLTFIENKTDKKTVITDSLLVKAIIESIKKLFSDAPLYLLNVQERERGRPNDEKYTPKSQTLFNLLFYFLKETDFINPAIDYKNPRINNKVSSLFAQLFIESHLDEPDILKHQATNSMNRRLVRLIKKQGSLLESYLMGNYNFDLDDNEDTDMLNYMMF